MGTHVLRWRHRREADVDAGSGAPDPGSLLDLTSRAHRTVWQGVGLPPERSPEHLTPTMDGPDTEDAYDAEVATLSEHLGAVEAVLHPAARRQVPGGPAVVTAQRRLARRMEQTMRLIEGHFYGDTYAMDLDVERLQQDLKRQIAAYARAELDLARSLDASLTPAQRDRLITHFVAAMRHAPTRPHPHLLHPRGLARLMMRACSAWDHALDVMDNRKIPGLPSPKRSAPLSLWDRYLLGTPGFQEAPRSAARAPAPWPTSSGPGTQ